MKTYVGVLALLSTAGCGPAEVSDLGARAPAGQVVMPEPAGSSSLTAQLPPIVPDAVGVRMTDRGLGFVAGQVSGKDLPYHADRISKPDVACYDAVGIDQFDLASHVNLADLDWQQTPNGLAVTVYIDYLNVDGELWGEDDDTFDLCPSFGVELQTMRLEQIVFTAHLKPYADQAYNLYVDFNQAPQMQVGNLVVDVGGFPDFIEDLVFSQEFVQEFLFRKINDALAEKVPELTKDALFYAMFTGSAGPFDYAIGPSSIEIDAEGANALFDIQVDFPGAAPACLPASPMPDFATRGTPGLGETATGSMAEIALADAGVNQVVWAAWKSGFLCFDSEEKPLEAFENVLAGINPAAGDLMKYRVVVAQPPRLLFEDGKVDAEVKEFFLEATVISTDGAEKTLLRIEADMRMGMRLDVDRATNRMLVSLDGTDLTFDTIESEVLFNEDRDTEEHLKEFVRGYVIPRLNAQIQGLPVTNTLFQAAEYFVLLDDLRMREGYAVAGVSLFAADDPEIDRIAPETDVVSNPGLVERTWASVEFAGTDDRAGQLLYSWRVDDAGWSAWSESTTAELEALTEGTHVFEVKARDRWANEDATPASVAFSVDAKDPSPSAGCRVDASRPRPGAGAVAALLAGALAVALSMRRRARI